MASPTPARRAARAAPRTQPCALCGEPATLLLRLAVGDQVRAAVPICNADAAALTIGEWWLTVRCMDRQRTLRGHDLQPDGSAF